MTVIGFIRHGVTDWNREGRAQGQNDVPLNDEGMYQAKLLAGRLAEEAWDYIFSSDLVRASGTADMIAAAMGKAVHRYDARLREKSHGRLDGTTVADRIELWGEGWNDLDHQEEPLESMLERSRSFLDEVTSTFFGKRVLVVSHGAWIRNTIGTLLPELTIDPIHNTSLTVLRKKEYAWECLLFNCIRHLQESVEIKAIDL